MSKTIHFKVTSNSNNIVWKIKHIYKLPQGEWICSPNFNFLKREWYLLIQDFPSHLNLYLLRNEVNYKDKVSCSISLQAKNSTISECEGNYIYRKGCDFRCVLSVRKNHIVDCLQSVNGELINVTCDVHSLKKKNTSDSMNLPSDEGVKSCLQSFQQLFLSGSQSDVQLKVGHQTFQAHKLILSIRSPIFNDWFQYFDIGGTANGVIEVVDCPEETFKDFLFFLYTGKCDKLNPINAISLYKTAEKFQVEQLKSVCRSCLIRTVPVEVVLEVVHLSALYDEAEIMKKASQVFVSNAEKLLSSEKWEKFMEENTDIANALLLKMPKRFKNRKNCLQT